MLQKTNDWKTLYHPEAALAWQGRRDSPIAERYHQAVQPADLTTNPPLDDSACAFVGFASDEGVRRNQGRPGAKEGPRALRKALSNFPLPSRKKITFYDVGDIACENGDLEAAQQALGQVVAHLLNQKIFPIVLGGGHETAWGHFQGIEAAFPESDCAIINFDAHFDLRPLSDDNKGSSGTPFSQIAASRQAQGLPFDYTCFGIQQTGNTASLFEKARELGVEIVTADDFYLGATQHCMDKLEAQISRHKMLFVTLCLDVLAAAYAPGISAPQPLGLTPWHIIPLFRRLAASGKVVGLDIAELSPPHDLHGQTAKTAAALLSEFTNNL